MTHTTLSETTPQNLASSQILPSAPSSSTPSPPGPSQATTDVLKNAPAAVKRSMPMALSITLGLLLAAALGIFFYKLTWFILILYLSFIAATILEAPLHALMRLGMRRGIAAMIIMVGGLAILLTLLYAIGNWLAGQTALISKNLENAPKQIDAFIKHLQQTHPGIADRLGDIDASKVISSIAPSVSSVLANAMAGIELLSWLVIMFFLILYMLVDGADHLKALRLLLPKNVRLDATRLFNDIAKAHRGWALASLANVTSSTILTGFGLLLCGIPGAFLLGFFAGLGELIPNIGPIVAATPALLLTLVAAPDHFLYVVGMFLVVWTLQGYGISPLMMKFSVELPVLVTLIAVLIFGTLFGILGILVSIPLVADLVVLWHFHAARCEKDCIDYDAANNTPTDRNPIFPDHPLKKLFRRTPGTPIS